MTELSSLGWFFGGFGMGFVTFVIWALTAREDGE